MASKVERDNRDLVGRNRPWKEKEKSPSSRRSSSRKNSSRKNSSSKTRPRNSKEQKKNLNRSPSYKNEPKSNISGTWSINNTNGRCKSLRKKKAKEGLSSAENDKDPANVPRSSQNKSDPSNFFSDLSALNKTRAKSRTQEEKENFMSVITSQLPTLLHQLTTPDLPKTTADDNFIRFMKYLEEQKISNSLQDVAETAISKLLELVGTEKTSLTQNLGPNIKKVLESEQAGALTVPTGVSDKPEASAESNLPSSTGQEVSYVNTSGATDKRYTEFMHLLEEKEVFVSLQSVVNEAVHRLFEAVKEEEAEEAEEADSVPNTASVPEKKKRRGSIKKKT